VKPLKTEVAFATPWFELLAKTVRPDEAPYYSLKVPDYAGRLPEPIRKFTGAIHDATHLSFLQGAGHGGSHPHLAHNFLMACLGKQPAFPDAPST